MNRVVSVLLCGLIWAGPVVAGEMTMPMAHKVKMSPAEAANAAAMHTMMTEMNVKVTGNADKDFARMMLAHHRGAIAMAKVELDYGKDPEMRALASDIIKAQEVEITQMQSWLAKH